MHLDQLARQLGITQPQLRRLRIKYRKDHGAEAEVKLKAYLEHLWSECRDKVRLMPRGVGDYVESRFAAMPGVDDHDPGESVPESFQTLLSESSWSTFDILRAEEIAKREARARSERLRQAELTLRQQGKSPDEYVKAIDKAVDAMTAAAKKAA